MLIQHPYGLPEGDTDAPRLITTPRGGIPQVCDTPEELQAAAQALSSVTTPVAIDVERAHGYRYHSHPYLIQIRREGSHTFLIDPIALPDLSVLSTNTDVPWLLHDASNDLPNLRYVGLHPTELFDTMIGARLIGLRRFGLQASCETLLGLSLAKDHQANDWSVRPLYTDWLRYAALDVELLTELYRCESLELDRLGRLEWAQQECEAVLNAPAPAPHPEPWRKNTGAGRLHYPKQLAVLRELWFLRERLAQEEDIDPRRLVPKDDLVEAARIQPRNRRTLLTIQGFRSPRARQYSAQWLHAIYTAIHLPPDQYPTRQGSTPEGELPAAHSWKLVNPEGYKRLQAVRHVIARIAQSLDLADEVVLQPRAQRHLAWEPLPASARVLQQVEKRLRNGGARQWQIELTAHPLARVFSV